ncbi:hypothetical protein SE91_28255 [Bradyrhizobium sp. DOA1]|nr:hypothetical protein SE91_28255 [Bradyrhizobium sp. DOA1]
MAVKKVKLGDYWEIGNDLDRLKITPLGIQPLRRAEQGVEICFQTQGSMFYGGAETKETGTNSFVLGVTRSGFQAEPLCAYQYSFSENHVHFKAVRVDHINAQANEVVLEICTVALRKLHRELK